MGDRDIPSVDPSLGYVERGELTEREVIGGGEGDGRQLAVLDQDVDRPLNEAEGLTSHGYASRAEYSSCEGR